MCNIRRSGRPVYGTTTTNPTIWKGLLWLSHLHQNAQGSRLAGTKPFDLHSLIAGPTSFIKMSKYVCEFKFPTISNGPII
jgi:hypothetical protein